MEQHNLVKVGGSLFGGDGGKLGSTDSATGGLYGEGVMVTQSMT